MFVMRMKAIGPEKRQKKSWSLWVVLAAVLFVVASCKKDPDPVPDPDPDPEIPKEILVINEWIWEGLNEVYLWEKFIPNLDYRKEPDPEEFFNKLLYDDDIYSWIVDDYEALLAMFEGVELVTGMSARPVLINDNDVVYVVEFVTPDSPAADSSIQRGDFIISIDNQLINRENYRDLYYQTTALFEFGGVSEGGIIHNGRFVELTAIELSQNPVVHSEVIDYEGAKIGYLVYTQFTSGPSGEWFDALNAVFEEFIAASVTDVVVDLRYNPGGSLDLSAYMASTLSSASSMENQEVFVKMVWNELYTQYWLSSDLDDNGQADGEDSEQLVIKLPHSDYNMDLSRVYFLTTDGTASACESLMIGLYPYINVIQIGTTTYGKCYGSFTVDDWENPKRHNWAMQPIVIKFANADGYTDFVNGIIPDYFIDEYLLDLVPFGSTEDPMLARALEDITGIAPLVTKSAARRIEYTPVPVPLKQIPERIFDWPVKPNLHQIN